MSSAILDRPAAVYSDIRSGTSTLTGTWALVRFIFRRDRVRLTVWAASIVATYAYFVVALGAMGQEALTARGNVMTGPAGVMMGGPGYGVQDYTLSIAFANEMILWVAIALGLMAILHVVRHTRTEEESSRSELVRAAVIGRHAPAVAAVISLVIVLVVIALLGAFAVNGMEPDHFPLADSLGMMFGISASALTFGAFAVIACQLTEHPRGATGMSLAFMALMYVVRVAGGLPERGGTTLSYFSTIGLAQQMRPFTDPSLPSPDGGGLRWWPILVILGVAVVLFVAGSSLASRRDFGAGMVASKPGPANAAASLRSVPALTWRQQRTSFWWWMVGMGVMWFATGTMIPDIAEMGIEAAGDNELFEQLFQLGGADAVGDAMLMGFLNVMGIFIALIFAAYAISAMNRARTEEISGRAENLLSTPTSRDTFLGSHLVITFGATAVMLIVSMVLMWAGGRSAGMTDPGFGDYVTTTLGYVAAIAVYVGVAAALFGWFPRFVQLAWVLIAWTFVFGVFGPIFNAPEWMNWINPLRWAPASFGADNAFHWAGFVGLLVAAAVLWALAFIGFRRRDVPAV